MKALIAILALLVTTVVSGKSETEYPLRDVRDGEGRSLWWYDVFYHPVVVVRGSLAEIQKDRPDLSIQGPYETWSKLTHPSLANIPTEKGFYLLLTRFKVAEVLYVDRTLLRSNRDINWLAEHKETEFDCLLPASIKQVGEPNEAEEGRYEFTYELDLPCGNAPEVKKEYILIFQYVSLYPIQGLHLTSFTDTANLKQVRKIAEYRRSQQRP